MLEEEFDEIDRETAEIYKQRQTDATGIVVIPWVFKSGFVNNTENGYVPVDAKPSAYSFFESIFTGKENIQVIWQNSTKLVKPLGVNRYNYFFQVGKYYLGCMISGRTSQGVVIDNVTDNEDFLALKDFQSVTLRFDFPASTLIEDNTESENMNAHYLFPKEEDWRKLYTIPELCGNKWLMITDVTMFNDTNTNNIVACEIQFTSVGDKLKQSGRATEQFIQYGACGDSWCLPTIKYEYENGVRINKRVGYKRNIPTPATHFQVEMLGAGAISSITLWGRKLHLNPSTGLYYFEEYKFLLPYRFATPQNNDINRSGTPSKNLFFFPSETLDLVTTKDWDQAWKDQNNSIAVNNMAGKLSCGLKGDWDTIEEGDHKSNEVVAGTSIRRDYFDNEWYPTAWLEDNQPSLSCEGNFYTENDLSYRNDMTAIDILVTNSFAYLNQLELPLGYKSSKPYKISNLPIIGGLVSAIIGDRTLNSHTVLREPMRIGYFMDCDLAGHLGNRGVIPQGEGDAGKGVAMFVNNLCGEDISNWLGVEACNLSMCFSLTDKININSHGSTIEWDTKYIGQNKDENGEYLFDDQKPLLFNTLSGTKVEQPDYAGFVIDKVLVQGLFAGKIRLSAYNISKNSELATPVWTTTVLSNAKWTGSMRNWTTEITTGGWDDRFIDRQDNFTWPEYPSKGIVYKWEMNYHTDLETSYSAGAPRRLLDDIGYTEHTSVNHVWKHVRPQVEERSYSIGYEDLGLPEVTDKTTFFNKVKGIRLNYRNSAMNLRVQIDRDEYNYPVSAGENEHYFEISEGIVIDTLKGVIGYHYNQDDMLVNRTDVPDQDIGTELHNFVQSASGYSTLGLRLRIRITFENDGLHLTVSDNSIFQDLYEDNDRDEYSYQLRTFNTGGTTRVAYLTTHLELHHIQFILK